MLHIVNKSPFQTSTLESCLRTAQPGDALLLIEDGVYAATQGSSANAQLLQAAARLKLYALRPDIDARGLGARVLEGVNLVDYAGFVDLTVEHSSSHSWL